MSRVFYILNSNFCFGTKFVGDLTLFRLGGYQIDTCLPFSHYLLHGFRSDNDDDKFQIGAGEVAEINHLNGSGKIKRKSVNFDGLLKNVKPHILEKVLNIYYLDFVLFGYDINPFLKILENKQNSTITIQ